MRLTRLGTDRIDIVYLHDPDDHEEQATREALPALLDLRAQGVIRAVGVTNQPAPGDAQDAAYRSPTGTSRASTLPGCASGHAQAGSYAHDGL